MSHPLVQQLRFTRSEFKRGLKGLTDEEARRRFLPLNCISWNVGHLAWQEQRYFLFFAQGQMLLQQVNDQFAYGAPASTPPLAEVLNAWNIITQAVDPWLDILTSEKLQEHIIHNGKPTQRVIGNMLQRVIYHYWYHNGENMAIRQNLGHSHLPEFVGNIDDEAPYRPE
ncbi:MAG: DinB family protein [Anaerolineaceae bacterium]|jgi:hypothetical protein